MSGHNPHGRLGQPNTSWNHLQVPSFIPRQPQLAHVHVNESLLRSSPLNWQPDTALYNYMAAAATQHKTPLELNPLLPAFVRPPLVNSFGSVDLSFQSHARHNLTPSPHNTNNTSMPNSVTPPLEFSSSLQFPLKSTLNSSSAILTPTSLKDVTSNIVNGDKVSNNVSLNDKLVSSDSVSASNLATGLFVAHQLNTDSIKNNAWMPPAAHTEPIELIKETVKIFKNAWMNEIIERNSAIDQTSFMPNHSPSTSLTDLSNSTRNNNPGTQRLLEIPSPLHGNTSNSHNTSRDSIATTSNDESLDSNGGKKRRRRKPNKTCRLSNNEIEDDILSNNNKHLELAVNNSFVNSADTRLKIMNESCESERSIELKNEISSVRIAKEPKAVETTSGSVSEIVAPESFSSAENSKNLENGVVGDNDKSIIVNNPSESLNSPVTRHRRSTSRITSPIELSQEQSSNCSSTSIQRRPGKRKLDTDDCETIDKIAAMIASSSPEFNPENGRSTPVRTVENPSPTENGNLKDILETADDPVDQKDNRFEDVEIKLEEMFAGIDDDPNETVKSSKAIGCKDVRVAIKNISLPDKVASKAVNKKNAKAAANRKMSTSSTCDEIDHKTKKNVKKLPKTKTKKGANKKKNKGGKGNNTATDNKKIKIKEEPADPISKFKGPFIHVRIDGSSNVVNAPITEEVAEQKSKIKKSFINQNLNDRNKIRGLHVSTLSMKYDAATTDKTWMCVFCKMGPHKFGLGDLFGPYILSTTSEDFAFSQVDPSEDLFKSKKTKFNKIQRRSLPTSLSASTTSGNPKRKRKATEPIPSTSSNSSNNSLSSCTSDAVDIFYGMTKADDSSYEVWVHGDCAVWSSGVHLIGTRIVGLDAAVWGSSRHQCVKCHNYGAMLCCFKRGCSDVAHIPCARKANWSLCDENFKVLCDKHCEKVDNTGSNIVKAT